VSTSPREIWATPTPWWEDARWRENEALADRRRGRRPQFTAGDHYLRAGNYYYTGERSFRRGKEARDYRKALRCYGRLEAPAPNIEFVEVPYEAKRCRPIS